MKDDSEAKLPLKKQLSSGLEPMEPLKPKTLPGVPGKGLPAKKSERAGQEQEPSDEEEEDEESEYQSSRLAQIEGQLRVGVPRSIGHRFLQDLNDDEYDDLLQLDIDEDDISNLTFDEVSHYMALSALAHQNDLDPVPIAQSCLSEEELQLKLIEKSVLESELELKRNELRYIAKYTCNPGIHRSGYRIYRAEDYEHLNTTPEIKELFEYISMYSPPPTASQVDVKLKPFIPEFYPSVGDIDAFLKVVHPEIGSDNLGIKVLDEPCAFQSDPSVLDLRLRAMAKQSSARAVVVKKVENVGKNAKVIDNWIKDISDLHRSKPSPSIHYSKPMPDIDQLLQEWPQGFEGLLSSAKLPPPELDCDLKTYVDLVCNLLDIPVYKSRIQSLHVLATLYLAHRSFGNYAIGGASSGKRKHGNPGVDVGGNAATHENGVDRLELE